MAIEPDVKKLKQMTTAERLAVLQEEKENQRYSFFTELLREEARLANAVYDAFEEEGLASPGKISSATL